MRKSVLLLGTIIVALLAGCVSVGYNGRPGPPTGLIATEGVSIRAMDNSFELVSGEVFSTPFFGNTAGVGMNSVGADMISYYQIALDQMNARRVRVTTPWLDEPLYGILLFSNLYYGGSGPATRSYQITVPENYVRAAVGGRISVVYETYPHDPPKDSFGETFECKSWVLWLSDVPL